jgi:hypothetical protein
MAAVFSVAGAVLILAGVAPSASLSPNSPRLAGEKVRVTLRTFGTNTGAGTKELGSIGMAAAPGESVGLAVGAGTFDRIGHVERGLCGGFSTGGSNHDAVIDQAPHVWVANILVREARMDGIDLVVHWAHYESSRQGHAVQVRGDSRTINLKEGERHLLDFEDVSEAGDNCPRNVLVQLEANVVENPDLAGEKLDLDAWLLDESGDGSRRVHRLVLEASQGQRVDFRFPTLAWPVREFQFDDGNSAEVWAGISGSVRGRVRLDGTFELALEAERRLGVRPSGTIGPSSLGDGGEKVVRVIPGETVRLVLPSPRGSCTISRDGQSDSVSQGESASPASSSGVGVEENRLNVRFGSFLADHKMSILLTAHRSR